MVVKKEFKNKQELVDFVKHQVSVELENDPNERANSKRKILYTSISDRNKYSILPLFHKYGIRYEKHLNDKYWVFVS